MTDSEDKLPVEPTEQKSNEESKESQSVPVHMNREKIREIADKIAPARSNIDGGQMTVGDHLEELRNRIISCLYALFGVVCICFVDQRFYMEAILLPHKRAMESLGMPATIQVLHYQESFFAHLKVAMIVALILTMPFIIYQLWLFVSTGLYEQEKKYFRLFFPFTIFFFSAGVGFGYFVLIPIGLRFLAGYGGNDIQIGFTLSSYVSLFFVLTFMAGLVFELPLVMLFLNKINIFTTKDYIGYWRHFILAAFVIAAVITPPDAVTQLLMATPMIILYFGGILLCRLSERLHLIRQFLLRDSLPKDSI